MRKIPCIYMVYLKDYFFNLIALYNFLIIFSRGDNPWLIIA